MIISNALALAKAQKSAINVPGAVENTEPLERLYLNPYDDSGSFAVWAAILPAYDTTYFCDSSHVGIHVHWRSKNSEIKDIDKTFKEVFINLSPVHSRHFVKLSKDAALAYRAGVVLNKHLKCLVCPHCKKQHLDSDFFSVNPHRKHLCEACRKTFLDDETSISNPVLSVQNKVGLSSLCNHVVRAKRKLVISQKNFKGGIKIWGSAPAILWRNLIKEESGIHVHAFNAIGQKVIDDTFGYVEIDGHNLNVKMVQYYTAQNSLQHLAKNLTCLFCPLCDKPHFDKKNCVTPHCRHLCEHCGYVFESTRKMVSNPFVYVKESLKRSF